MSSLTVAPKAPSNWAVYSGPSMNPTLTEPSVMDVRPYASSGAIQPGDVVFFRPPDRPTGIVHRVLRVTPAGLVTRGDNNPTDDPDLVSTTWVVGRVVAAQTGLHCRLVAGGRLGLARHYVLRAWRLANRRLSRLLHPAYQALSRSGLFPALSARVVAFRRAEGEVWRALLGSRVIGEYDARRRAWRIRRPYRLVVDERTLPRPV